MFDISFVELLLILVVALVVIGPERLPRVARTMGFWVGRARSVFNSVRRDIEREARLDELKQAERDFRKDLDVGLNEDVMKGADGKPGDSSSRSSRRQGSTGEDAARPAAGNAPRSIADDDAPAVAETDGVKKDGERRQGDDGNT